MTTTAVSSSTSASQSYTAPRQTIAENFDAFLLLLTTQLQHQNPLDPLDANQFTQQLVQFASVEQQIKTNDNLTALVAVSLASQATAALGLIGSTVTVAGAETALTDGKAEWTFNADKSGVAVISVLDAEGNTVFSQERAMNAGSNTFTWDGMSSSNSKMADGVYTLQVSGRDAAGSPVAVTTEVTGVVDGIDVSGSVPLLKIGDVTVSLDKIRSVRRT